LIVLLIGSGGREHALAISLAKSPDLSKMYSSPGNPGINKIAENVNLILNDHQSVVDFCKDKSVDLVVIGPEQPLADGLADSLRSAGINAFGPSKAAAQLESSKGFAKEFMLRYNIPTASFQTFISGDEHNALNYADTLGYPVVIKADGLAAGKGVVIALNHEEAETAINNMMGGLFDNAGKSLVIEEFMQGEEASIFAITDGTDFITLAPAQDHKRIFDGDLGPNTGGMGAYAPAPVVTEDVMTEVKEKIIIPVLREMGCEGNPFIGCLYVGVMIKDGVPKVVEFNCRFGDPETQVVMPLVDGDVLKLFYSAAIGKLDQSSVNTSINGHACCVVLASQGYPGDYEKNFPISGIENAESHGAFVYHAGTSDADGVIHSSGGRVLGVSAVAGNLKEAVSKAYVSVNMIHFENAFFRKDIAHRAL
jgi:phosphoribosylamine--glycine ligase